MRRFNTLQAEFLRGVVEWAQNHTNYGKYVGGSVLFHIDNEYPLKELRIDMLEWLEDSCELYCERLAESYGNITDISPAELSQELTAANELSASVRAEIRKEINTQWRERGVPDQG